MESDLSWWGRVVKRVSFNRLGRMHDHYEAVCAQLRPKTSGEMDEVVFFQARFNHYSRVVEILWRIKMFFYLVLYATIFVGVLAVLGEFFPWLEFIAQVIKLLSVVLGPVSLVAVFYLNAKINLSLELMQDCMMHLVAIYHKNHRRDTKASLARIARAI
jgi:hypothetical protein